MPSPERAIAEIVTTKWNATAQLATDVPGGLHWELYQAPADGSGTTRPYCVFDMPGGAAGKIQAGTADEIIVRKVRFRAFGKQTEVYPAIATIRDTFHRALLSTPTGGAFISCLPADGGEAVVEMWQRDGEQVWRGTVAFNIRIVLN